MACDENTFVVLEAGTDAVVERAFVLTPDMPFATVALMTLARCWEQLSPEIANDLRQTAVEWAPQPEVPEFPDIEAAS